MSHVASHLAAFDSDPVLARAQESLSPGGSNISSIAMAGLAPMSAGADIFNTLIHLAVNSSRPTVPMATSSSQPSSAGPAIGAGIGGLAVGAGLAGAALSGKGKPMINTVNTAPAGGAPVPPTKIPGGKPGTGVPAPKTGTTPMPPVKTDAKPGPNPDDIVPIPVPGIPEKPATKPAPTTPKATASKTAVSGAPSPSPAEVAAGKSLPPASWSSPSASSPPPAPTSTPAATASSAVPPASGNPFLNQIGIPSSAGTIILPPSSSPAFKF